MQICVICASHPLTNHSHLQLPRNIKSYKDQAIDEDGAGVDQQTYHLRRSFRILCSTGSITMVPKSSMDSWSHVKPHEYELKSDLKSKCHPRCQASPNATDVVVLTICTLPIYEKPGTFHCKNKRFHFARPSFRVHDKSLNSETTTSSFNLRLFGFIGVF